MTILYALLVLVVTMLTITIASLYDITFFSNSLFAFYIEHLRLNKQQQKHRGKI